MIRPSEQRRKSRPRADDPLGLLPAEPDSSADPLGILEPQKPQGATPSTGPIGDFNLGDSVVFGDKPAARRDTALSLPGVPLPADHPAAAPEPGVLDRFANWYSHTFASPDPKAMNPSAEPTPVENRSLVRPIDTRTVGEQAVAARQAGARLIDSAAAADVSGTPGATLVPANNPAGFTTAAAMDASKTMASIKANAELSGRFSPEKLRDIARRGMELGSALNAQGKHDEAQRVLTLAYNTQVVAEDARQADTSPAIALSNLLGIVHDPYAEQRRNLGEFGADPSLGFTPEEQQSMGVNLPTANRRGFDPVRDLAAPLVGMAPTFELGGLAGRGAAGIAAGLAERAGYEGIGSAIGRVAQIGDEAGVTLGPRVPLASRSLVGTRLEEEVAQLRGQLPHMLKRGATQGQVVGALQSYRMARQQGATPEEALKGAVEGAFVNVPMGIGAEVGMGLAGRAFGLGFDPIGRVAREARDRFSGRNRVEEAAVSAAVPPPMATVDAARAREGKLPASDQMPGLHRDIAASLEELLGQKKAETQRSYEDIFAQQEQTPAGPEWWNAVPPEDIPRATSTGRPLGPEPLHEPLIEQPNVIGGRPRGRVSEPIPTAVEAAMRRAGVEPDIRPIDEANAHFRLGRSALDAQEHQRIAVEEAQTALNDPNLRLEQAAQQRPGEVQGPRTLEETLREVGERQQQGDPMAQEYHDAINKYVDAAAAVRDAGEGGPNTRSQIALARAKAALNAVRTKYGKQLGASAVLALAANDSDLSDEEKKIVGLGGMAILSTDVVPLREGHPLVERVPFYSRLTKAVEALPKKWENPVPAADWIGKLKGTTTFKKEELALILPSLEEAQRAKIKLSRDDVRQIIADKVPKLERRTLQNPELPVSGYDNNGIVRGDNLPEIADVGDIETALEENPAAYHSTQLQEQIEARQARIQELRDEISETQTNYENELEAARDHSRSELNWVENKVREAGLDDSILEPALEFIRDNTDSEGTHMPYDRTAGRQQRGDPLDHAMSLIIDDLYESKPHEELLREGGYTWEKEPEEAPEYKARVRVVHSIDLSPDALDFPGHPDYRHMVERGPPVERGAGYPESERTGRRVLDDGRTEDIWGAGNPRAEGARTIEEHVQKAREIYGPDAEISVLDNQHEIDEHNNDPNKKEEWVVRDRRGREVARDEYEDGALEQAVEEEGLQGDNDELHVDVKRGLDDYMGALAREYEADSNHNYYVEMEDDAFREQFEEIEQHESDIPRLEELATQADEREQARMLPAGEDMPTGPLDEVQGPTDAEPAAEVEQPEEIVQPEIHGRPRWEGTQMIPGAKNYREVLTVQTNRKGDAYIPAHSYEEFQNLVGHARVGDYEVHQTPDISGAEVEFRSGEPEEIRTTKAHIVEKRKGRDEAFKQMNTIAQEFEELPREKQQDSSVVERYRRRYMEQNQRAIDLTKREDELSARLRDLQGSLLGMDSPEPITVSVLAENQSDHAQAAGKYGVRQPEVPVTPERVAELKETYDRAALEYTQTQNSARVARIATGRAQEEFDRIMYGDRSREDMDRLTDLYRRETARRNAARDTARIEAIDRGEEPPDMPHYSYYPPANYDILNPAYAHEFELMAEIIPGAREKIEELRTAVRAEEAQQAVAVRAEEAHTDAREEYEAAVGGYRRGNEYNKVPPSPFITGGTTYDPKAKRWDAEGGQAYVLGVAAFLHDLADRGVTHGAISDAANRIKNAHLSFGAADLVYEQISPSAVKKLMNSLGFDIKLDKIYIRGEGHTHFELTREMREKIKRIGFPLMSVLALAALPKEAEAEEAGGSKGGKGSMYATALGGLAAGAALAYLATSRSGRRLLKENEQLRNALMRDDLSGLANKTAFQRALPSVNADEKYHWVVFDGDRFKKLNDTAGHTAGDRAITHFGQTIRDVAEEMGIPMRGFRTGGDEFAFAAPAGRSAEFQRRVEEKSEYTEGGTTTRMTGGSGSTYEAADAMAGEAKRRAKEEDPSLRRTPLSNAAVPEDLRKVVEQAADKAGIPRRPLELHANPIGPALRELAKYPSAATLAAVGAIATQSDDPDIKATGKPLLALSALHAIGARRLIAGKDLLADKLLQQLSKSEEGTSVARFFNPDALLHPAVRQAILDYEQTVAKGVARANEFSARAKELGPQGDRAVSDVIEGEDWEDTSKMAPKDLQAVLVFASALDAEFQKLGRDKVAAGVMEPSSLLPGYAGPRRYAFHEAADVLKEKAQTGGGGASKRIGAQKSRTLDEPIRDAQRALDEAKVGGDPQEIQDAQDALDEAKVVQMSQRVERGEIRESSYRAAQGIQKGYSDVAAAKLFATLRDHPGVAHPDWVNAVDDLQAAQSMRKTATTPADRQLADGLIRDAKVKIDEITRKYQQKGGDYVSLPDTPGLGKLRGAVVQRDVANSLQGFQSKGLYAKTLRAWKNVKTIFNPGTHVANILSNIAFAHMEGLGMHEQPLWLKRAAQDARRYGPMTRALTENGTLGHNAVTTENQGAIGRSMKSEEGLTELLGTTRPETADVLRKQGITEERAASQSRKRTAKYVLGGAALGAAKMYDDEDPGSSLAMGAALGAAGGLGAAKFGEAIRKAYGGEDDLFRIAIGMKKMSQGMSLADAAKEAQNALGNFRSRSPALQMARSTIAPFLLYPAKALPRFAQQVVDHPWRYMALMALWGGLNEYSQQQEGEVPDIDVPPGQRRLMGYFAPGFTQLPMHGDQGERAAVDVGRWLPTSALTSGAPPGSIPAALDAHTPDIFRAGGPAVDLIAKFGANVNPYTQEPMYRADYPPRENIRHLLNDAAGTMLPSALDVHAANIKEDIQNRDVDKLKNDALGPSGLRPRFIRPGANARSATFELQQSLSQMKQALTKDLIANKNPNRTSVIQQRYLLRVRQALANYRERLGVEPPPELVRDAMSTSP